MHTTMHSNSQDDLRDEPNSDESTIDGFALSPQQARVWQSHCDHLTAALHLRLPADTSIPRLQRSLAQLMDQHEILRTHYRRLPGMRLPVQVIAPAAPAPDFEEESDPTAAIAVTLAPAQGGALHLHMRMPPAHADAASLRQLAAAWARAYAGAPPAAEPLQYADYAAWRSELVASQPEAQAFWDHALTARAPTPILPLHMPAPASIAPAQPAALPVSLAPATQQAWLRQAAAWEVDPAILALAAWIALLHQHTRAERLTLGLDWQARGDHLGQALGLFSEPVPLTVDALDRHRTDDLCQALQRRCAELVEWRDYFPSAPQATAAPLAFCYIPEDSAADQAALAAAGWHIERAHSPTTPHGLLLEHRAAPDAPALTLRYDPAIYSPAAADMLGEQLATLLADALQRPTCALPALSPMSAAERGRVTEVFGRAAPLPDARANDYARIAALPHLAACFDEQLRQRAGQPAVQGAGGVLSYTALDHLATRLAQVLLARGVAPGRPGRRVAHFLPRDTDAVVAMLAIFKAGATYVPIAPGDPASRIAHVLDDCGADLILTRRDQAAHLPAPWREGARVLFTDDPPAPAPASPWPDIHPEHEAYLIYTSGSTGAPKGVPITHAGALHSLAARVAYYPHPVRHFLLLSSLAFDSSIAGLFWTLAQGGCLHLCTEAEQRDPGRLAAIIRDRGISHLLALPSLYQALLQILATQRTTPTALTTAIVAGETCPRALVQAHHHTLPGARLYNEYGPTEAAVWSTVAAPAPAPDHQPVPIGRPIPHARAYLLDAHQQPVARGITGELYLGGPGLSPGYLRQPQLTADKFVHIAGERLYRTGDHAYRDEHGDLVFLGRADAQVKIRGHRVELGEIEAALRRVTGAAQVAVLAAPDSHGQLALRGFVESPHPMDPGAVRAELASHLPAYMIPADLQRLPALPRLANGKLDRSTLLALQPRRARAPYAAPRGHTERTLAVLWEDLLGSKHVGRHDDFFALGGHSLLAVRLVHRIQAALHARIPVSTIIERSTLAALAARIESGAPPSPLIHLRPGDHARAPLFCLHRPSGDVHHYLPLIEHLPAEQPALGVPLPAGRDSDNTTLAALASAYLAIIREAQPHGPYHLCGWSMGGLLALELCHQLEQRGERVAFLALLDTTFETADEPLPMDQLLALCRAELTAGSAARLDALPATAHQRLRAATEGSGRLAQLRHLLLDWAPRQGLTLAAPDEAVHLVLDTMHSARAWVAGYTPPVVAADLHMWWAHDTLARHPGLPRAWQAMTRGQTHHTTVPGDHDTILHAPALHESFRESLCAALAGGGHS